MDGIDLKHFEPGQKYEVGSALGALMLAEGWASPLDDDEPMVTPFSDADPFMSKVIDRKESSNLIRESYPPSADEIAMAADFDRRKRSRRRADRR